MAKTEVYSWRLAPEKKRALEDRARSRGETISQLLDRLTEELLASRADVDYEAEQRRLHAAAAKTIGVIASASLRGSETVEQEIYRQLKRRHGR
jgi:hypothetical protein